MFDGDSPQQVAIDYLCLEKRSAFQLLKPQLILTAQWLLLLMMLISWCSLVVLFMWLVDLVLGALCSIFHASLLWAIFFYGALTHASANQIFPTSSPCLLFGRLNWWWYPLASYSQALCSMFLVSIKQCIQVLNSVCRKCYSYG